MQPSPRSVPFSVAALSMAATTLLAARAGAQSIVFDNTCGSLIWRGCCTNDGPPGHCFNYNNWDTGITTCESRECPREPASGDDVAIGNFVVLNDGFTTIHSLTTATAFRNTGGIVVSGTAVYSGPVSGDGYYGGTGTHTYLGLVTADVPGQAIELSWPATGVYQGGIEVLPGASFSVLGQAYSTGNTTWRSQSFRIDGAYGGGEQTVFHNQQGALFLATADGSVSGFIGLGHFENAGTFRKDGGLGTTTVAVEFKNLATGVLDVRTGILSLNQAQTLRGTALISAGAQLELRATGTVPGTFTQSGAGTFRVPGVFNVDAGASASLESLDTHLFNGEAGIRGGAGLVTVSREALLSGALSDGGTTELNGTCHGSIGGFQFQVNTDTTLNNRGVLAWQDANIVLLGGASINNLATGLLDCQSTATMGASFTEGVATNAGTFRSSVPGALHAVNVLFTNSGRVECLAGELVFKKFHQTGGLTLLGGGELSAVNLEERLSFEGGALRGSGNIRGHLGNTGATFAPGPATGGIGTITLSNPNGPNSYIQGPGGTFEAQIGGPGAAHDLVSIVGYAVVDGTLNVSVLNSYVPISGADFDVLTCANLSGQFATVHLPRGFSVQYLPTALRIHYTGFCNADFNGDGDVGTDADIEAFFACLAGNCCATCGSADFNADGDVGTDQDIESFFRVLAGGIC